MSGVLMSIGTTEGVTGGPIYFFMPLPDQDTPNFETVQKDSAFTWTSQGRLSRRPAMQFTGPGEEVITIAGRLYPQFFGGTSTLDALRAAGVAGNPLLLMRHSPLANNQYGFQGDSVGYYVIRRVRSDNQRFNQDGAPLRIDFNLELALYGDDLAGASSITAASTTTTDGTLADGQAAPAATPDASATTGTTDNVDGSTTTTMLWT